MNEELPTSDKLYSCLSGIAKFDKYITSVKRQKVFLSLVEEANTLLTKLLNQSGTYSTDQTEEK